MYNRMAEPGFERKDGFLEQEQAPPMYPPPNMQPVQQQPMQPQPMQAPGYMHSSNTNTTVVVQQQPQQFIVQGPRPWTTGLCSCFDDCGVCLLAVFCPFIHDCILSSNAGECCCVACACPIALRTKIRIRHNIAGSIMDDCCTLACCGICAKCQMARELNIHGI